MTATEAILNYATMQGRTFHRKDLLLDVARRKEDIRVEAIDLQINRLIASGMLRRVGHGEYELTDNSLPEFCIWSPNVLASFMLHVPNIGYTFIDVEKDGMESVFNALQGMELNRNILLSPSLMDCDRYLTGTDAIVVRQLIGQSPLTEVDGCTVPRIEKIMVDAIGDNELFFASGSEIYNIFEYARERNHVNMSKLLRYASRRNRKTKVEQIINSIDNDKSKKQIP